VDTGGVAVKQHRAPTPTQRYNHTHNTPAVKVGDRIAQLILEKIAIGEVEEVDDLSATVRGAGGVGAPGGAPPAPAARGGAGGGGGGEGGRQKARAGGGRPVNT